jgi:hypothetical protein
MKKLKFQKWLIVLFTAFFSFMCYLPDVCFSQDKNRLFVVNDEFKSPLEIVSVKTKTNEIKPNTQFTDDESWFKGLSVKVKNNYESSINFIELSVKFPRPIKDKKNVDFVYPITFGYDPRRPKNPQISVIKESLLLPEKEMSMILLDSEYDDLIDLLDELKFPKNINTIRLNITAIGFQDGTLWMAGGIYQQDYDNPEKLTLKKN